jgi:2-polyprenyl-6-hydroxyphenyl methylase/3-demethylubiquinone-9 3-methyltransferase
VEWFVKNTPRDLHVLRLFIRPQELTEMCERSGLHAPELRGVRPVFLSQAFLRLLFRGIVTPDFRFAFTRATQIAYTGVATRRGRRQEFA